MATSKTSLEDAIAKLRKSAAESDVTPKGKAPKSNGGNPEAKSPVSNPGDSDGDADGEPEELNEGNISRSTKKGKITNQFAGNEGDEPGEGKSAKKSLAEKLRDKAKQLRKGAFDDGSDMGDSSMDDGSGVESEGTDDGSGMGDDDGLSALMDQLRAHPKVVKAVAAALAEAAMGASPGTADDSDDDDSADDSDYDEDYGDDEPDDSEEMSMGINYVDALSKAMASLDETGELKKAISAEPVVATLAGYLVELGNELLTRHDELTDIVKSQGKEIASLKKSLNKASETIDGLADVTIAAHEQQAEMAKSLNAVANSPRVPSPGVIFGNQPLNKSKDTTPTINIEALRKSLEDDANNGHLAAANALVMIDANPNAALATLSDEGRKTYESLAGK